MNNFRTRHVFEMFWDFGSQIDDEIFAGEFNRWRCDEVWGRSGPKRFEMAVQIVDITSKPFPNSYNSHGNANYRHNVETVFKLVY